MYEQMNIFDLTLPKFQIDKPIRLIELFAGIGSQAMALRNLGADFEHHRISEWEINSNKSYKAIHMPDDNTDYSKKFEKFKWIARVLYEYGISVDGKKRMTLQEIKNRGEKWCRQIYNELMATHNVGSITKIHPLDLKITDTDEYCYIMTYSFPCQDLSLAGKQKGMAKSSGTRSGLLWEVERILNEVEHLPQVLLMENVPQVHSKANMPDFQKWIDFLLSKGYSNYWKDLNAKDYGVAQNRNRCFMVSILGEWNYKFPTPMPPSKTIKDYLEDEVGEKYYIDNEKTQKLIQMIVENGADNKTSDYEMDGNFNQRGKVHEEESVCRTILGNGHAGNEPKICVDLSINNPTKKQFSNCITTKDRGISNQRGVGNGVIVYKKDILESVEMKVKVIGQMDNTIDHTFESANRVYDIQGIAPTINTCSGGGLQPKILTNAASIRMVRTDEGKALRRQYESHEIHHEFNEYRKLELRQDGVTNTLSTVQKDNYICVAMRGRNSDNPSDRTAGSPTEQNGQGICNTLASVQKDDIVMEHQYRIRKLTPLECWRLMGFSDEDFHKAETVNSNSQLYKQAGNSIVKNVLMAILGRIIPEKENVYKET